MLDDLASAGQLLLRHGHAVLSGAGSARTAALASHPYLVALDESPFTPPAPATFGVEPDALRQLVADGLVVEHGGCYFSVQALERAATIVGELLRRHPGGVTASVVRQGLGTSRKYALPLLALLDRAGVTRRRGDVRVAGPALPAPGREDPIWAVPPDARRAR